MNIYFPLVSILIPVYNAEKYLSTTIESLLKQTYENIEIIIIDDSSTDKSFDIAKKYELSHKHIKVFQQEKSGAQVARNNAYKMSKGQYIQYFDADDIMHVDKISSQMERLQQYGYKSDIVATGISMAFYDSIDNAILKKTILHKDYDNNFLFLKESWENSKSIIGQSWLIPRLLHDKVGGWKEDLIKNQDGEFFTRVAYNANQIVFIEKSVVYYRKTAQGISNDRSLLAVKSHLDSYKMYVAIVKNDLDKQDLRKAAAILFTTFYKMYYPLKEEIKNDVSLQIKALGYDKPVLKFRFNIQSLMILLFGLDKALELRQKKKKLF